MKTYYEENENGKYKVIEQDNGVKIKLMREMSASYKAKLQKQREIGKINQDKKNKEREREQLIQKKMRELAIKELEKEGKI